MTITAFEEDFELRGRARQVAIKGKQIEADKVSRGWRYVRADNTTKVLVPCDKNGNPTDEGLVRLERCRKMLGLSIACR